LAGWRPGSQRRAEPPQHTLNAGIGLAASGCVCLCRAGRKKKQYTPKPKAWKEERSPPKSKASAPFQQNNSTESGGRGVREETQTQTPAASRQCLPRPPRQTAPAPHAAAPASVRCLSGGRVLRPTPEPSNRDLQRQILENHPEGSWGKQNPAGERDTSNPSASPQAQSHPLGESSCPTHGPGGLTENQTPPHGHSALLATS